MASINQGAMANLNGHSVEGVLEHLFSTKGFTILPSAQYEQTPPERRPGGNVVLKNVPYETIYGSQGRTEFVVISGSRRIRIESKYQSSPGSVDEKFPYMLLNAIQTYPEPEVVLLVTGGGYKPGAYQWLHNQIAANWLNFQGRGKSISLMGLDQFITWFNRQQWQ